ncbi:hypothetical protein D4764_05G0010080 [Takifugu flavidus]|uniref:Endonuclease/exonuclease/phosphatase domain-containing protein n=1 Tax=Takifugu flavidus TaxID=433684 RepID=A0A5C6N2D8_9TELE|nr:hypothetical protein D4764_05G0010080 [Takifugu flavidus]
MGNVNSLANKIDELAALGNQRIYRFTAVRADRDTKACGKSKGGGLIIYTNNRWCNPGHVSVKAIHSVAARLQTKHPEALLIISGDFNHVTLDSTLAALHQSDHNLVYVQPQYTPLVQRQAASTRSIRRWTPEAEEALKDCFNTTDWDVLLGEHEEDIDGMTDRLTDYLNFCVDVVVPTKTV